MSTGIVSSKEGHDELHIDDTKLKTYFWNDVNVVTIRLTQKYWHNDYVDYRGKNYSNPLWTSDGTTKILGSMTEWDKHTVRKWTMHSFERLKGVIWLMKVDRHKDQLNTQLIEMIWRQVPCSKAMKNYCHLFAKLFPSYFPHHDRWVPLFYFTSSKRVTNTRYSSSEDKSKLICFTNLREERFVPKKGSLNV